MTQKLAFVSLRGRGIQFSGRVVSFNGLTLRTTTSIDPTVRVDMRGFVAISRYKSECAGAEVSNQRNLDAGCVIATVFSMLFDELDTKSFILLLASSCSQFTALMSVVVGRVRQVWRVGTR